MNLLFFRFLLSAMCLSQTLPHSFGAPWRCYFTTAAVPCLSPLHIAFLILTCTENKQALLDVFVHLPRGACAVTTAVGRTIGISGRKWPRVGVSIGQSGQAFGLKACKRFWLMGAGQSKREQRVAAREGDTSAAQSSIHTGREHPAARQPQGCQAAGSRRDWPLSAQRRAPLPQRSQKSAAQSESDPLLLLLLLSLLLLRRRFRFLSLLLLFRFLSLLRFFSLRRLRSFSFRFFSFLRRFLRHS